MSPFGGVMIAEDGDGKNHLVGATEDGRAYFLARNELPGDNEFAGPTFSNDKKFLFANVQSPGHVFAIQGPFRTPVGPPRRPPPVRGAHLVSA